MVRYQANALLVSSSALASDGRLSEALRAGRRSTPGLIGAPVHHSMLQVVEEEAISYHCNKN